MARGNDKVGFCDVTSTKRFFIEDYVDELLHRAGSLLTEEDVDGGFVFIGDETSPVMSMDRVYAISGLEFTVSPNKDKSLLLTVVGTDTPLQPVGKMTIVDTRCGDAVMGTQDLQHAHFGLSHKGKITKLLVEIAGKIIDSHSIWKDFQSVGGIKKLPVTIKHAELTSLYSRYLYTSDSIELTERCSFFGNIICEYIQEIKSFLAEDYWNMHFLKYENDILSIEKGPDFRIWDWERRVATGELK